MSNIGLSASTFRITGKYLDILNDFIVKARINPDLNEAKKDQVIDLLNKIKDVNSNQPQFQLLLNIIDRELRLSNKKSEVYLNSIIKEIEENDVSKSLDKIEFLVEVLDSENSEALSKIKGE